MTVRSTVRRERCKARSAVQSKAVDERQTARARRGRGGPRRHELGLLLARHLQGPDLDVVEDLEHGQVPRGLVLAQRVREELPGDLELPPLYHLRRRRHELV